MIAAALLIVFGAFSVSQSFPNQNLDGDRLIPVGAAYLVITVHGFQGLLLQVHYFLESAGTIDVYVLTADEYALFQSTYYVGANLYAEVNRTAGAFNYTFSALATYYITFSHHSGITGDQQAMHLTVAATGINGPFFAGGIAMIGLAGVLVVVALRRRKATRRAFRSGLTRRGPALYGPRGPR